MNTYNLKYEKFCSGKRITSEKPPAKLSLYPKNASWRKTDQSCAFNCRVGEYLYWGFQSYTGLGPQSFILLRWQLFFEA